MYLRQIAKAPPANVMAPYLMQSIKGMGDKGKFVGIGASPGGGTDTVKKSKMDAMLENLNQGKAKK